MHRLRVIWLSLRITLPALMLLMAANVSAAGLLTSVGPRVRTTQLLLYVANFLSSSITEFRLNSSGDVTPFRIISGPRTGLHHPFGLARDSHANLYAVNSAYPPSIAVFAPHAGGNVTPVCAIEGRRTGLAQPLWIAIDASDTIFVTDAGPTAPAWGASVRVFAAGACGDVSPIRVVAGPATQLRYPSGITFDRSGHLIVASSDGVQPSTSAGLRFSHDASGDIAPEIFGGPDSGLALPFGITSDPMTHAFWVANPGDASVVSYAQSSSTRLEPVTRIAGAHTGFVLQSVTGVALDMNSNLYVSNRFANPNIDNISIFAAGSGGDRAPTAVIRGSRTQLFGPGGLLIAAQ